jgi:hypothetical protein
MYADRFPYDFKRGVVDFLEVASLTRAGKTREAQHAWEAVVIPAWSSRDDYLGIWARAMIQVREDYRAAIKRLLTAGELPPD